MFEYFDCDIMYTVLNASIIFLHREFRLEIITADIYLFIFFFDPDIPFGGYLTARAYYNLIHNLTETRFVT